MTTSRPRRYCCVYGCLNNTSSHPALSYFSLPSASERRSQWLTLISREDLTDRNTSHRVCQIHFKIEDVQMKTIHKTLKKSALPSLHLPGLFKEEKETQTEVIITITANASSQTDLSNVSDSELEIDLTAEGVTTKTEISNTSDNIIQTPVDLTPSTRHKRKLESELLECKKRLKVQETGQAAETSQQNMLNKLCNRFLSKDLTELVKAQARFKSTCTGNRYSFSYKMFCLSLYNVSPRAYNLLAKTICLPSRPTLNKMYIPISTEINDDLMTAFKLKVNNMSEKEKQCTLVADAMSLKTNLFYDIKHDKIIGFHEIDGLQSPSPANYVLAFLVRGIYVKWSQPIGFALASESKNDTNISKWIDKIIIKLFDIGLNVRAFVSDLGPDFLNAAEDRGISVERTHFTVNDHKIYYIIDAPHLIKLIRNDLMTYDFHFHNSAVAKYEHIVKFYEFDKKKTYKQAHKLTDSHINPNNFEKKEVRYATQLLSRSVAAGLSTCIDFEVIDESARHTVQFIKIMNDLFDALNSSTLSHSYLYKKAFCGDERQIDFFNGMLTFFQNLKIINPKRGHEVTKTVEWIQGFQITIKSVLDLYKDLNQEGFNYLMTRRLNKDVTENFFRKVRSTIGMATEPTSRQFISAFRRLYVTNIMKAHKAGNFEEDLTKFLDSLRDVESIQKNDLEEIESDDTDNVRQILRSDYSQVVIPENNAFFYICGALLKECIDYHKDCDVLKSYFNQVTCNLGDESSYINRRNDLIAPPNDFVSNIERMEQIFQKAFEKDHINFKIGTSIYNQIKDLELTLPCPCFPKIYLQKLFIRLRIFIAVKMNNKAFRISRNRRKYFSVSNL